MASVAFERMRLTSHAAIRQRLRDHDQQLRLWAGRRDRCRTCCYFARSAFLRCAVHPLGDPPTCPDYRPTDPNDP
ncbi:DUF6464 family protein [Spirulina major CS-329]|uniref:DUF6464 family protein n=1 Tax=Spirulina TaxID=1154 RepID=UPI00232EB7B2|nr:MULTISPECIES: DUF6464 family protein [Spirulina]MDB9493137.1 DUF6464 family protein [Spirulina subsalsa CS-330]MDB9501905.1 DUF6464 family protein [Spirulina major CS-329]